MTAPQPDPSTAPNRTLLWANLVVDELIRSGLRHVCIAPGSRSTPLALAFYDRRHEIQIYSHLDERSAAYFALGLGLATHQPAAVLCTSGTAAANFYPAVIEAYQSRVPLLVLTADRAHELRDSGANQTIDQVKLYGTNVLWAVDVALPEATPPTVLLRSLRTLVNRALATAGGVTNVVKGPVHLNFPFRKPLEPIPVAADHTTIPATAQSRPEGLPFSTILSEHCTLSADQAQSLASLVNAYERGLILCGPNTPADADSAMAELSQRTAYPVIVDGLASLRFSPFNRDVTIISTHDSFLDKIPQVQPDVLIRFGNVPTSTAVINWSMALQARYVLHFNDKWADDSHQVSHLIQADVAAACQTVAALVEPRPPTDWLRLWQQTDQAVWQTLESELCGDFFDGQVVADVADMLPDDSLLFIGNSLPVRHLDQFARPTTRRLHVYANRGASGIDGVVSSALGVAAARPEHPLTLVIGDISFYHDMNGLLAVQRCGIPITIVLINNNGGGIFRRLPVRDFEPGFTDLFLTPHGLKFEHAANLYGLAYYRVHSRDDFRQVFSESSTQARLIEVLTDSVHDWSRRQAISEAAAQTAQQAFSRLSAQGKQG